MHKLLYLLFFVFTNVSLFSQKNESNVYSLDECITIALQNNLDIQMAKSRTASADADLKNAFASYLPNLYYNAGYTRTLNAKPIFGLDPVYNSYNMSLGSGLVIFDGFSRSSNFTRAEENINSIKSNIAYTLEKIKLDIHKNYLNVINKMQVLKARKENLDLGMKELERVKAQAEAGTVPKGDVFAQEAELGNREYDMISAENNLNIAKANLLIIMGKDPDSRAEFLEKSLPVDIDSSEIASFKQQTANIAVATSKALSNRYDYLSQKASIASAEAGIKTAYSYYYPTLSANGGVSWLNSQIDFKEVTSSIGLTFSLNIFDHYATNLKIETARLQLQQSEIGIRQLEQSIRISIQTAIVNLEAAEKQLDVANRAIKSARRNYESTTERRNVGSASITELLNANTQYIISQINKINTVYSYLQARKELLFALGQY